MVKVFTFLSILVFQNLILRLNAFVFSMFCFLPMIQSNYTIQFVNSNSSLKSALASLGFQSK